MQKRTNAKINTEKMVIGAVMTAFVIVFQLLASFTTFFGPFSTAMALIPIVIGAAICGVGVGGWLGFVFGVVVLASGGATFFMGFDVLGTIVTVLLKGTACGLAAGLIYKLLKKYNKYIAVITASLVCPIVNTGFFLLGCLVFFMDDINMIAEALKSEAAGFAIFWGLAMGNFLLELAANLVISPVTVRLLEIARSKKN